MFVGERLVGVLKLRHYLNEFLEKHGGHIGYGIRPSERRKGYGDKILQLALPEAKKLGLEKVLLTCNDDNLGSISIIEKSGGILQDKIESGGKLTRRYWINL